MQLSGSGALGDFLAIHIKNNLGKKLRVRADTFGYLQRSFAGCVSPTDAEEARQVGRKAAEAALMGDVDGSIAIQRISSDPYRVDLAAVAGKTRHLDMKYIADNNNISDGFREYAEPLVGKLPIVDNLRMPRVEAAV